MTLHITSQWERSCDCAPVTWAYGTLCPAMVSPNVGPHKEGKLLYPDHHLIRCTQKWIQARADSAMKSDPTHHPSPASVLRKISRIVTRSHTKEDDLDMNVPKNTELDNKPTPRITRSHKVASTGNLSQPSLTENEAQRMRTRSQSSDKSENSLKSSKNMDTSRDSTLDVMVSLLNMKIDPQTKYMVSPTG